MTTVTADLRNFAGGKQPGAELWITGPTIKDLSSGVLYSGDLLKIPFDYRGRVQRDLVPSGTAGTDPGEWVYGFQVKWDGGELPKFYAEVVDSDDPVNLATLAPVADTDPVYVPRPGTATEVALIALAEVVAGKADAELLEVVQQGLSSKVNSSTYTAGIAALAASIETAVEDAVEAHTPGIELAFAEMFAPVNTDVATFPGYTIPGLSCTVTGKGRPVDVRFVAPNIFHSVAGAGVTFYLIVNDVPLTAQGQVLGTVSYKTTDGPGLLLERRTVLADGGSYTFKIGMFGGAAGTSTINAGGFAPIELSVTSR